VTPEQYEDTRRKIWIDNIVGCITKRLGEEQAELPGADKLARDAVFHIVELEKRVVLLQARLREAGLPWKEDQKYIDGDLWGYLPEDRRPTSDEKK
jgi:hypothetical protein